VARRCRCARLTLDGPHAMALLSPGDAARRSAVVFAMPHFAQRGAPPHCRENEA